MNAKAALLGAALAACGSAAGGPPLAPDGDGGRPSLTERPDPVVREAPRESAQAQRIATASEALEASYARERQRWDPELTQEVRQIVERDHDGIGEAIDAVLASRHRVPGNPERDRYRHPKRTLQFFGLRQDMRVVEMFPGGGWYTELVAPLLAKRGKLVVPAYDPDGPPDTSDTYLGRSLQLLLGKSDALFGAVERVPQRPGQGLDLGPEGSADMVLAIREMHNWLRFGTWEEYLAEAHAVLVPGGVLAVVQHRARPRARPTQSAKRGYLPEPWLIDTVESAGFKLVDKSELNANPKDSKDHEAGVWTLPPTLRLGDSHKAHYLEIGESDRMTLRFVKQ